MWGPTGVVHQFRERGPVSSFCVPVREPCQTKLHEVRQVGQLVEIDLLDLVLPAVGVVVGVVAAVVEVPRLADLQLTRQKKKQLVKLLKSLQLTLLILEELCECAAVS